MLSHFSENKVEGFVSVETSDLDFWRREFPCPGELVSLPMDRPRPPVPSYVRDSAEMTLPLSTSDGLRKLCSRLNVPPLAVFLAAFSTVLFRYASQEAVVVGAVTQPGYLAGEVPRKSFPLFPIKSRTSFLKDVSGDHLARELARLLVDAEAHAAYSFRELQSWAGVPDGAFGHRLFNVALCLADVSDQSTLGWPMADPDLSEFLAQCDMTITVVPAVSGITLQGDFDVDLFEKSTIERLLGHVGIVLEGMIRDSSSPVVQLPILTPVERQQLLVEWNTGNARIPSYETLHQWFEAQVACTPDAVALTYEGRSLTYEELNLRANRLAHALRARGVGPEVIVGLCLERSLELVISLLAILKSGGAYLPIDLAYPKDRLAFMLEDARAPFLVTQSKLAADLPVHQAQVICVDDAELSEFQSYQTFNPLGGATAESLAYIIYTSGTTGKSKGALIRHRNVTRLFTATEAWYAFDERDVWTLFHSTAFDFSVWEMWGALLYGGRVVVVPFMVSRAPEAFYELVSREQVTVLNQTPSAFRQLIQAEEFLGKKDLALRYVIFGGEALELQSLRAWFERHGDQRPRLVNMYGITETTVHVTYRPISMNELESGSVIGVPIPDLQVYILDEQQQPVPIGVPGEMFVGGAGLARGYLSRPELTSERFIPDHLTDKPEGRLYRTGDLARFLPGRDIEYLGRIDHQVKIRGFRIELGEVESVLCRHPMVREAVVIAREDTPGVKSLAAYLVTSFPAPDVVSLREHLKKQLPDYMVPAAFVFMDKLPLTSNGKMDRKALPAPEQQRPELSRRYEAPRTPVEEKFSAIWSKVLRVERVGIHDNFFELGGDSILSIQTISLARREGLMLTPKQMFAHQTIAELAAVVEVKEDVQAIRPVVAGDVPLAPIQQWLFEQNLEEIQHYNQALLIEVTDRMDRGLLERALKELSQYHDALRLRYLREGPKWRQCYSPVEEVPPLSWENVPESDEAGHRRYVESVAASAQTNLSIASGPLWRVVYFDAGPERPGRLLFVVHHLAVDGISWRPLLEDLETAYQALKADHAARLPEKTSSYKEWTEELEEFVKTDALREELPYWMSVTEPIGLNEAIAPSGIVNGSSENNTEGTSVTIKVALSTGETDALLHRVPASYNTQINDALLTALARAWVRWSGDCVLFANLEGHGREHLLRDLDLSRTVGWFTSIFPVRLELSETEKDWHPGEALKSIKEQLRRVPRRGIGYGLLRYLEPESSLSARPEPSIVFNYFGQLDQLLSGSKLFRFTSESTGPWHSPKQRRRYALEVNGMVIDGHLELSWTYCPALHTESAINQLTNEFLAALKELIAHCELPNIGGRTPSDFPLARIDQPTLDQLMDGRRDIEDIYPLAPIQSLFFSLNPDAKLSEFDQWRCALRGHLDVAAFQRAWHETVHRHTILRTTIHGEGLNTPMQVVYRGVRLPWTVEDWRGLPSHEHAERWASFVKKDRAQPLTLTEVPVMRFVLVHLTDDSWRFMWSVPALLLDGWSWPIVFREASQLYEAYSMKQPIVLDSARPYREYLEWLGSQSPGEAHAFWRENLKGFREPTQLASGVPDVHEDGDRYAEYPVLFSGEKSNELQLMARRLQLTLSTLVQGAWALLLNRQSGAADVVFGAAFSGRPTDLCGVESIVGPFVNNVPVRVHVNSDSRTGEFFRLLHTRLLALSPFQFTPLLEIQDCSEVSWQYRLFESLVVFQNYMVDKAARRFGGRISISEFIGPIHTNYPILLLAEPGVTLKLTLIYDRQRMAQAVVERWGRDLLMLMERLPASIDQPLGELQEILSAPVEFSVRPRRRILAESQNYVPPQTEMEKLIVVVWQRMFGLEQVSVEDNLFDLGGHSLLLVQMHGRLRVALKRNFPLVSLFIYPTIRSLARHFSQEPDQVSRTIEAWRDRARQQKDALNQLRNKRGRK